MEMNDGNSDSVAVTYSQYLVKFPFYTYRYLHKLFIGIRDKHSQQVGR